MLAELVVAVGSIEIYGDPGPEKGAVLQRLALREQTSVDLEQLHEKVQGLGKNWELGAVCCEAGGRYTLYLGWTKRRAKFGQPRRWTTARLAEPYQQLYSQAMEQIEAAVKGGRAGEDESKPYSWMEDPGIRAIQERLRREAPKDFSHLRAVLEGARSERERAAAAYALPYAAQDQRCMDALVAAFFDRSETVRNNAVRAAARLLVQPELQVPWEAPLRLLRSPVWTDRNKAAMLLLPMARKQREEFPQRLGGEERRALEQMAGWTASGHAGMGRELLELAGLQRGR